MSRVGKKPIAIPEGVTVVVGQGEVKIRGAKGELSYNIPQDLAAEVRGQEVIVSRKNDSKTAKSLHGLLARVIKNATFGVTVGWSKTLELVGTGYRARVDGGNLVLSIGFSHPVVISPPEGITLAVSENKVTVSGADKAIIGQVAANIRKVRPPEPYQGKGIRYEGEYVRKKAGKSAKTAVA